MQHSDEHNLVFNMVCYGTCCAFLAYIPGVWEGAGPAQAWTASEAMIGRPGAAGAPAGDFDQRQRLFFTKILSIADNRNNLSLTFDACLLISNTRLYI